MKLQLKPKNLFVLFVLVAALLLFYVLRQREAIDTSLAQFFVYPVLLVLFYKLRFFKVVVPPWALVFGIVGASYSVASAYTAYRSTGAGLLVARLAGDEFESESDIFRREISSFVEGKEGFTVTRYHATIKSDAEARDLLSDSKALAVAWGDTDWVNISFATLPALELSQFGISPMFEEFGDLKPVRSVPIIGLSFKPMKVTARFLAGLERALLSETPTEIYDLALIATSWSSFAHRSFAWWKLGNLYLEQVLSKDSYEPGELDCARKAYQEALGLMDPADNPELYAAISNNLAISLIMHSRLDGDKRAMRKARKLLKAGAATLQVKNIFDLPYVAGKVAKQNGRILRSAYRYLDNETPLKPEKKAGKRKHALKR